MSVIIEGMKVYGEDHTYEDGYIEIVDGKITAVGDRKSRQHIGDESQIFSFGKDVVCLPGFIDDHIHGAAGADTMDATSEALTTMAQALPAEGTTSFLATTMTQDTAAIEKALDNAGDYIHQQHDGTQSEVIGIHLEGPFISPEKVGAQPPEYVQAPDVSLFRKWQERSGNHIMLVTVAPERKGGHELIHYLAKTGVIASIGHSNATFDQVKDAVNAGAKQVTHLYNGMRGLHHREPGVAGAALLLDELSAEVIADGIHTRPEMVELAYRMKGEKGLVAITDSLRAKCLHNGTYDLGGQDVTVENGEARLANGSLAGSILKMNEAVRNLFTFTGCSFEEIAAITSANPARQLGVADRKGGIAPGKDGDLVILDQDCRVMMTFCRGTVAYSNEEEQP